MSEYQFLPDRPMSGYRKGDTLFIISVLVLWGLGVFTILSCTTARGESLFDGNKYYFIKRHLAASGIGFIGMVFFSWIDMKVIRKFIFPVTFFTLILCMLPFVPGIGNEANGASRWIRLASVSFQPSEVVKLVIVLYLSHMFVAHSREYAEQRGEFIYPVIALIMFSVVIIAQKDLSTSVFVFFIGLLVFFVSGASLKWLIPVGILAIPAGIYQISIEPYRLQRVLARIFPDEYKFSSGYQTTFAARAISAGGIWGVGAGSGLEVISTIPEVQTDFIFAGWASSMGLIGVTAYFAVLIVFTFRGFRISSECPDKFASYASFSFTTAIMFQSMVNIAVVANMIPTTGIPLPFMSFGGSSLIITLCMCGFIINASHCPSDLDDDYDGGLDDSLESYNGVMVDYE